MIFKKLCVNEVLYTIEETDELKKMIVKAGQKFPGPMGDVSQPGVGESDKKKVRRRQECIVKDMGTALVICNNVTPVEDNGGTNAVYCSESSSGFQSRRDSLG
jgi:phospholipid-translocating ATPase